MNERREIHDRVLNAKNADQLADAYAEWAGRYDSDLVTEMGYVAHAAAAALLHAHVAAPGAHILDAGCGTGLVGLELAGLGHRRLTGLDYSADMLAEAERKGVYEALLQGDLTQRLEFRDGQFDAVVCVGTLTLGHVGPDALGELVRVTRPGGLVCFTVRSEAWTQHDYEAAIAALGEAGACVLLTDEVVPYIREEGSTCHLCLLRAS